MWSKVIEILLTQGGLLGLMVVALGIALVYIYKQKTVVENKYQKSLEDQAERCRTHQKEIADAQANQWKEVRALLGEWYETMRKEDTEARKATIESNEKIATALTSVTNSLGILLDRLNGRRS